MQRYFAPVIESACCQASLERKLLARMQLPCKAHACLYIRSDDGTLCLFVQVNNYMVYDSG